MSVSSFVRILAMCLAVAFAAQATGVLGALDTLASPSCCSDACPLESSDDGECPPACAMCVFAKVVRAPTAPLAAPVSVENATTALTQQSPYVPDGVRHDVFHPPRA